MTANSTSALKIIAAGLKILDGDESRKLVVSELKQEKDPADIAGDGVAKLMGILMNQSKGTMPMKAAMPAATILMCEALDRLEALGKVEVDKATLAQAMKSLASSMMQLIGATPDKLESLLAQTRRPEQAPPMPQPAEAAPEAPPAGPQPLIGAPA